MLDKPDTWAWLVTWLEHQWPAIYAAALGFWIAALRVIYGGGGLRKAALEAPLCGFITLSASSGLEVFGLTGASAPFIGGIIGLLGVEGVRSLARRYAERPLESRP
ncbi:phage holin, lambda family [Pseudomonas mangiferae]|uniref:Phage holin, lambda family n=1 Tax=Pseudomonas mangiferae TaxID=2593654 RepID=A0A553H0K1_9PSED|nr:phage holin, lambda family [Pseudomonas mangiferae]TRX75269.1 phage holin, lambda family [Pseudomonas mangiferae]